MIQKCCEVEVLGNTYRIKDRGKGKYSSSHSYIVVRKIPERKIFKWKYLGWIVEKENASFEDIVGPLEKCYQISLDIKAEKWHNKYIKKRKREN